MPLFRRNEKMTKFTIRVGLVRVVCVSHYNCFMDPWEPGQFNGVFSLVVSEILSWTRNGEGRSSPRSIRNQIPTY